MTEFLSLTYTFGLMAVMYATAVVNFNVSIRRAELPIEITLATERSASPTMVATYDTCAVCGARLTVANLRYNKCPISGEYEYQCRTCKHLRADEHYHTRPVE